MFQVTGSKPRHAVLLHVVNHGVTQVQCTARHIVLRVHMAIMNGSRRVNLYVRWYYIETDQRNTSLNNQFYIHRDIGHGITAHRTTIEHNRLRPLLLQHCGE